MSESRTARLDARPAHRRAEAEAETVPALRLIDAQARSRHRALTRAATVLASALAAVGLFGVVTLHVVLTQGQAQLDQLQARADAESIRNGRLTVEIAELEAPARVVEAARGRLGMVPMAAIVYLPSTDPATPLPPVAAPKALPPVSAPPLSAPTPTTPLPAPTPTTVAPSLTAMPAAATASGRP